MLLSSGAFEPMPIAIHRRNRDAWNLKDRKPKHNSTKLCMCVKGRKNVNIMLVVFCCLFITSRIMMSVFKNGFHFVWMCLSLEMVLVCMLQYKNTYWIKFHRLLIFFCYSFIGIFIHCGLTGILKGFIYLHLYVYECLYLKMFFFFFHSTEYTNITFHWTIVNKLLY